MTAARTPRITTSRIKAKTKSDSQDAAILNGTPAEPASISSASASPSTFTAADQIQNGGDSHSEASEWSEPLSNGGDIGDNLDELDGADELMGEIHDEI